MAPVMVSRVGTLCCSFTTWVVGARVFSFHAITESSAISLSWIIARISVTSAKWAKSQTAVRVVLYDLMKFLYAFMWTSCVSDVISSSNVFNAVWINHHKSFSFVRVLGPQGDLCLCHRGHHGFTLCGGFLLQR